MSLKLMFRHSVTHRLPSTQGQKLYKKMLTSRGSQDGGWQERGEGEGVSE